MEKIIKNPDRETPMAFIGEKVRVDWYRAGEGYHGDYNPDDPNDEELLRFDVYYRTTPKSEWEAVEDASYCTTNPVTSDEDVLERKLRILYKEYADVLEDDPKRSVKKLGEKLSWI